MYGEVFRIIDDVEHGEWFHMNARKMNDLFGGNKGFLSEYKFWINNEILIDQTISLISFR